MSAKPKLYVLETGLNAAWRLKYEIRISKFETISNIQYYKLQTYLSGKLGYFPVLEFVSDLGFRISDL